MIGIIIGIVLLVISGLAFMSYKIKNKEDDGFFSLALSVICFILCIAVFILTTCITIDAGTVGVKSTLGTVDPDPYTPGFYLNNPLTSVKVFKTQTQQDTQSLDVVSAEGLAVKVGLTVQYSLEPSYAPELYKTVGENYVPVVIEPEVRSATRDIIAMYDAKSLYSSERSNLSVQLGKEIEPAFKRHGIILEKVLISGVTLPASISQAIEAKQQMEQQIQQKQFEVQKEQSEADRKRVEAQGIADANKIIGNSITPSYNLWYTIDMLKNHHSDSMMFVPIGSNGLPLVSNIPLTNST